MILPKLLLSQFPAFSDFSAYAILAHLLPGDVIYISDCQSSQRKSTLTAALLFPQLVYMLYYLFAISSHTRVADFGMKWREWKSGKWHRDMQQAKDVDSVPEVM